MEQEIKERFDRIEADLEAASRGLRVTQGLLNVVVGSQQHLQELFGKTQESIVAYIDASNEQMKRMDEQMKRMEANFDALIRIITAEHTNGHNKL